LKKRAQHVVTENERVKQAAVALEQNDFESFGRALNESHTSLQKDFEVSCDELDLMVQLARGQPGVFGARMTGGGFGGCTINFVRGEVVSSFVDRVSAAYAHETGIKPAIYVCRASDGAGEVENVEPFE
jgi:galactokinase